MANCNCCIPISCAHCTGYLGFLLTALGIVLVILEPAIVNFGLEQQLTITEGTLFQEQFIEPTLPITISVYMWNVTNADLFTFEETRDGQGRWNFPPPYVEQVGPFLYDEHWLKDQFIYYDDNENVVENPSEGDQKRLKKVQARQTWKYRSLYDPNDPSTGLNPDEYRGNFASILANALPNIVEYAIRDQGKILKAELRDIVNKILAESKALPILKNISVTEALFHYEDPILKYIDLYCRTQEH